MRNHSKLCEIKDFINKDQIMQSLNYDKLKNILNKDSSFIHVCIQMHSKGIPTQHSLIYFNNEKDHSDVLPQICSKVNDLIGFIISGKFSFKHGVGIAKGFISCNGMIKCLTKKIVNNQ